jgi:hypothetical protein
MKHINNKGKTRKLNTKKSKALSIPELKHAFDKIQQEAHRILKKGETTGQQVKEFQKVWKTIFHRPVSTASAEAYLVGKRLSESRGSKGSKTRKMKGGALAGAPLDSITQPGINGVHGSFPAYQSQGLAFYDTINKQGMYQECGIRDISPVIDASTGSNKVQSGGKLADLGHLALYSPVGSSVPSSILEEGTAALKGFPSMPSSDPTDNPRIQL